MGIKNSRENRETPHRYIYFTLKKPSTREERRKNYRINLLITMLKVTEWGGSPLITDQNRCTQTARKLRGSTNLPIPKALRSLR